VIIGDENDLREQLDRTFEPVTPSPAPIEDAVRRGKAIRGRRRAGAVASLAVVVAVAVAVAVQPVQHSVREASPASGHYTATVHVPSPNAPAGAIAYGTVNGQWWELVASQPGTDGAGPGQQLVMASGAAFGSSGVADVEPPFAPDPSSPVALTALQSGTTQCQFGAVAADVSYVTVRLGNGIVLTLHPVTVFGARVVAFAVPAGTEIVSATAYSGHGEISTAIPFNGGPAGLASFGLWLKPGQRQPARFSGRIGSGTFDGKPWSATAYLGPWGLCVEDSGGGTSGDSCVPVIAGLGTSVMFWTAGTPDVASGSAAAQVTRLVVTRPDGSTTQVRPVQVGGQKFFAFAMSAGHKKVRWAAYDSSGGLVASSTLIPDVGAAG
jgi:hypothetical protein